MEITTIVALIALVALLALGALFLLLGSGGGSSIGGQQAVNNNLRSLVAAQRASNRVGETPSMKQAKQNLALAAATAGDVDRKKTSTTSVMTLEKKLRYARWPITPLQFRAIQLFVALICFIPTYLHATVFIQIMVVALAPLMLDGLLDRSIGKRFEMFDEDYPVILLSYVSLLKTGMNAIQGLEAAAKGLDPESLVRAEVELLIERLRLGLTEEQAISAFGEDVAHPELELFVQSLILSRRVGGTLSNTLERLARQVRKRQQFRKQAVAAVGMERSSLYMIALIMGLLLGYLMFTSPELVFPAFKHPLGNKIFQCGIMLIVFGFYWSRRVTNIKI